MSVPGNPPGARAGPPEPVPAARPGPAWLPHRQRCRPAGSAIAARCEARSSSAGPMVTMPAATSLAGANSRAASGPRRWRPPCRVIRSCLTSCTGSRSKTAAGAIRACASGRSASAMWRRKERGSRPRFSYCQTSLRLMVGVSLVSNGTARPAFLDIPGGQMQPRSSSLIYSNLSGARSDKAHL